MSDTDYDSEVEYFSREGGWLDELSDSDSPAEESIFNELSNIIIKGGKVLISHITNNETQTDVKSEDTRPRGVKRKRCEN